MKKIIFIAVSVFSFVLIPASYSPIYALTDNASDLELRADDIRYRYKSINCKLSLILFILYQVICLGTWFFCIIKLMK